MAAFRTDGLCEGTKAYDRVEVDQASTARPRLRPSPLQRRQCRVQHPSPLAIALFAPQTLRPQVNIEDQTNSDLEARLRVPTPIAFHHLCPPTSPSLSLVVLSAHIDGRQCRCDATMDAASGRTRWTLFFFHPTLLARIDDHRPALRKQTSFTPCGQRSTTRRLRLRRSLLRSRGSNCKSLFHSSPPSHSMLIYVTRLDSVLRMCTHSSLRKFIDLSSRDTSNTTRS